MSVWPIVNGIFRSVVGVVVGWVFWCVCHADYTGRAPESYPTAQLVSVETSEQTVCMERRLHSWCSVELYAQPRQLLPK